MSGGEPRNTHVERTTPVSIHQTRSETLDLDVGKHPVDFSKFGVSARSQSGPLERTVGLTGKYTPAWALEKPPGVEVDISYMTFVRYIKSFAKTVADEPDRVVRGHWNEGLRKYTCGSKYFKEWKAKQLAAFTSNPDEKNFRSIEPDVISQSGEMRQEGATITTESEVEQTVQFQTDVDQVKVDISTVVDSTRLQASVKNTELGEFLSRPLRIASYNLTNGFYLNVSFNPWSEFLDSPAVKNKLQNYSLLRGTMHVKFLINGGPFYFGNIICSYKPRGVGFDLVQGDDPTALQNSFFHKAMIMSQRQHLILNPTTSQGGELTLPFFHNKNYLDLIDATDVLDMGEISMLSLVKLERAIGAAEQRQINITVMAWMSDVELAGPTTRAVFSQSGKMEDEYGKGIISRPAKAIARWAGKLKAIPEIGPYATATSMAAAGIGSLAELWGFSRPMNVSPIQRYKHQMHGMLAPSSIDEAVEKLTYDPKQELTVDHNVTGAQLDDEMSIKMITSKSSLITYFDWSATANENTLVGTINVHPCHCQPRTDGTLEYGIEWVQTPLSHATFPFKYWRGGINFRFQINCSDLHRGRLLIVYDPRGFDSVQPPDTNTAFSRIIDIEETKDFTIPIYWFQQKSWAKVPHEPTALGIAKGADVLTDQAEYSNGQLRVYVLNELTGPDEDVTTSVRILTFISGAEDYEVAVPDDYMIKRTAFGGSFEHTTMEVNEAWSQSGIIADASSQSGILNNTKSALASKPGHAGSEMLEPIGEPSKTDALSLVYHGETFDSFRDMFKRYNLSGVFVQNNSISYLIGRSTRYRLYLPNFPMYNGRAETNGMYQQPRYGGLYAVNYNIAGRTLLNWITPAYAARRGGIRYKYMLGHFADSNPTAMVVTRGAGADMSAFGSSLLRLDSSASSQHGVYSQVQETGHNGSAFTSRDIPVLEVELPYYSDKKFEDASSIVTADQYDQAHVLDIYIGSVKEQGNIECFQYVATGEDFNLTWYVNAPSFFVQTYSHNPGGI